MAGSSKSRRGSATAAPSANGIRTSTRWASRCAARAASATRVSCGGPAYLLPRETMMARIAPKLLETVQQIDADIGTASPAD